MKILHKKISLGWVIAAMFIMATAVYSLGYKMAMDKFNNVLSYTQEKQKMYSSLSELDSNIRKGYVAEIKESDLLKAVCAGYTRGLNDVNCKLFTPAEYQAFTKEQDSVSADVKSEKLSNDIGYIKLNSLNSGAGNNFTNAVDELIDNHAEKIIIDMREVNAGKEDEAFKVIKHLLGGDATVSTLDAENKKSVVCKCDGTGINAKIIALVNSNTSGASEIIASALKDEESAQVVGEGTAGNCVRIKSATLSDDSVVIFPDAYYITKSENIIFKSGVKPDVKSGSLSDEDAELLKKGALSYDADSQIQDAIALLNV